MNTPCINYPGHIGPQGYGIVHENGNKIRAHRYAWEKENGPIPEGMLCLHRCDNRACWNTEHLYIGTHQDNMKEMTERKRAAAGDKSGRSKLTEAQVAEIKRRSEAGELGKSLAAEFGVHYITIGRILNGKSRVRG